MGILDRFRLDGQVAVVTGGGRGIGEGLALGLAEAGADVVVAARRTHEVEAVAEKVRALGRRALAVTADVMEIGQVQALAGKAFAEMGALTCWVSNAGGADDRVPRTFLEMPERQWDFQLNLNLKAVWTGAQAAANIMKDHGGGHHHQHLVVGRRTRRPLQRPLRRGQERGWTTLTQTLAAEMAGLGHPRQRRRAGADSHRGVMEFLNLKEEEIPELGERFQIPLGRVGTPEDITPAVVYLASDASSWMTGHTISIKGGP